MTVTCCARARRGRCSGTRSSAPSTLGTFLRAFTFGHVRQLDKVLAECLWRAWEAGAGPGDDRLIIDVDSFVGEVYGYDKQGAGYGYTHKLGYHPILATRAETGEVLHIRARKGSANTCRGALRFVEELIPRVARAGASGPKLLRADSGFWNAKIMARLQAARLELFDRDHASRSTSGPLSRRSPSPTGSRSRTTPRAGRRRSRRRCSDTSG